jgi:glycosyltransferase involved in cell wall biosynthesis
MRVVHLLLSTGWGGAERVACTVHRLARANGIESFLDAPYLPELARGVEHENREALPGAPTENSALRWVFAARERRRRLRPDIVHAHLATPGLAGAALLAAGSAPLVLTFQLLPDRPRWPNDYIVPVASDVVLKLILKTKTKRRLVAVSAVDRSELEARFREPVVFAPNAPPLPPPSSEPVVLHWEPGKLRVLAVGRLHAQKGFDRALRALAAPAIRAIPWHLCVLGDGEERGALEQLARSLGLGARVTFAGAQPSHEAFPQAELVLCTSRFEGRPLVPQEAISAKVPVVLSDIPAHREILPSLPEAFLPEDERDWPDRLAAVLSSPEARARLRAQQAEALGPDPRERMWSEYHALYTEMLG